MEYSILLLFIAILMNEFLKPKKRKNKYKKNNNISFENIKKIFNNQQTYKKNIYTNTNNWKKDNNMEQKKSKTISIKVIGEHFNKSSREMNKIFEELQWIEQKGRWWILTPAGEERGGKELYNPKNKTKYTVWKDTILHDNKLINKINLLSEQNENIDLYENNKTDGYNSLYKNNKKKPMTRKEKKEKGNMYETYVANFFRKLGYTVWEHGKEKGVKDSSIDLIVKKEQYIYFIQCKNWETWKINHKEIKATRTDIREYLKENKIFWELIKDYKYKLLYITPKKCLTKGAYQYIQENSDIVEYQIIPIKN